MVAPPAGTPFDLKVMLDVGAADQVTGVSFDVQTNNSGKVWLMNRTVTHPLFKDDGPIIIWPPPFPRLLHPKSGRDLGVGAPDAATPAPPGPQELMVLTFQFEPDQTLDYPVTLSIVGFAAFDQGFWVDPDFNTWSLPVTTFTLTPEPASLALLACGAVWLSRRRRV